MRSTRPVKMELFYSPDEYIGSNFLSALTGTTFIYDIIDSKLDLKRTHIIYHCKDCEANRFSTRHKNCLSGGRYCGMGKGKLYSGEEVMV